MGTTLPHLDEDVRDDLDQDVWESDETDSHTDDDYNWTGWPVDFRWRPVTAVLGAVVALGAIATAVIINSGDSATTKATVGPSAPRPVTSAPADRPAPPKTTTPPTASALPQLPPETVTTMAPPSTAPGYGPSRTLTQVPPAAPPLAAPPPQAALNPRTIVYNVTGSKQLLDLVNIVYTDARGYPQTEFNVSLPWSKVIVLNPGVQTESVVATSFYGQLNCSIINAAGQAVAASVNNASLATCAR